MTPLTIGQVEELDRAISKLALSAAAAEEYLAKASDPQKPGELSALRQLVIRSLRDSRCELDVLRQKTLAW